MAVPAGQPDRIPGRVLPGGTRQEVLLMSKSQPKTDEGFRAFIKERDESLLSLDEKKIRAYAKKYNVKMPEDSKTFWAGIHKARCAIGSIPEAEKQKSRDWLKENGFRELGR
jgi:hypothetical protein